MPYAAVTRATLRARLQDRYTGDPFWTDTDANDMLNETLRLFNLYTGYWRGTATANTSANSPFVAVPAALTAQTRIEVAGNPLTRKSILGLYRTRRTWRTDTTTSGSPIPTTIREWAPVGLRQIAIWPHTVVGGDVITFNGVKITPILSADGSFLDVGEEELTLILGEALYALAFKRPSLLEQLRPGHDAFLQGMLERNDQLRMSSFYREALGLPEEQRAVYIRRRNDRDQEDGTQGAAGAAQNRSAGGG